MYNVLYLAQTILKYFGFFISPELYLTYFNDKFKFFL